MERIPENSGKEPSLLPEHNAQHRQREKIVIGIAGTAKNTGKTTTLNCLLKEAAHRKISVAVTGIGYDGEETDNVTLLPKPRINVYPDTVVTTSERCLENSTAHVEILRRTGMYTALGEILVIRVLRTGLIVIAGPGKKKELHLVIENMLQYDVDHVFVDGSLNRIAPMSVVDSIVFTTGGSRSMDISMLCSEMHAIESLFRLPLALPEMHSVPGTVVVPFLLEPADVEGLLTKLTPEVTTLAVSHVISPIALERLVEIAVRGGLTIHRMIFPDPFALLMNDNIVHALRNVNELRKGKVSVVYRHVPKLACITANPFSPQLIGNRYIFQYLDAAELVHQLRSSCTTPVFNTQITAPSILFNACLQ